MMKVYIAPSVLMIDAKIDNHLLAGSPHPDDTIKISTSEDDIPVNSTDAGTKHPTNVDYAKGHDSWTLWDE